MSVKCPRAGPCPGPCAGSVRSAVIDRIALAGPRVVQQKRPGRFRAGPFADLGRAGDTGQSTWPCHSGTRVSGCSTLSVTPAPAYHLSAPFPVRRADSDGWSRPVTSSYVIRLARNAGSKSIIVYALSARPSTKPSSLRLRTGCWSLRMAFASICRTRSRVTLKILPTSSNV